MAYLAYIRLMMGAGAGIAIGIDASTCTIQNRGNGNPKGVQDSRTIPPIRGLFFVLLNSGERNAFDVVELGL